MSEGTMRCPFCGEEILAIAKKCKHCGSMLEGTAPPATAATPAKPAADYGAALLAIPAVSTMLVLFWVSGMNLFQSPSETLVLIMLGTVVGTASIAAMEASRVGMVTDRQDGTYSATAWFFLIALMWIIGYPTYLAKRKRYGLANRAGLGVLVGLMFLGSWGGMTSAIEAKKAEIRGNLEKMQSSLGALSASPEPPPAPVVTMTDFEQLQTGMTYAQAVQIIGVYGEEMSRSDIAGYRTVMYAWSNGDGSNMNAMFQNNSLINKAQIGLR